MKIDEIIILTKSIIDEVEKHPEEWQLIKEFALKFTPDEKEYFKQVMYEYRDMRYKTDNKNQYQTSTKKEVMSDEDFYSLIKN
jgi:hypothetical protein